MASNTENRKVRIIADGSQAESSIKQMSAAAAILNAELKKLPKNSQAFADKVKEFQQVQAQLRATTQEVHNLSSASQKFWTDFKKIAGAVVGGNILTGMLNSLKQIGSQAISMKLEMEEAMIDVQKVTNLSNRELKQLQENIGNINTRTSRKELMDLAYQAGKLGKSSVEDISAFVRAANQINVALGRDLGDEAVTTIGKLSSIFKLEDQFGLEQGMLKIASAINEIGMASTANEQYLVEFSKRMSGVAGITNLQAADVIALAGTLDSLGQTAEVSSTALSKLFVKMGQDTETFAKYAGMSMEDFSNLLQTDIMEAFKAVLSGVGGSASGIESLAKVLGDLGVDGGRVVGVLGSLATNVNELTRQQDIANKAFENGTSVTNEYKKKNESAQASVERLWKVLRKNLADNIITQGFTNLLVSLGKWVAKNDELESQLNAQKSSLFKLRLELNQSNISAERRKEIIKELQQQYPSYLVNIDAEKVSTDELNSVLDNINKNLIKNLILRKKQIEAESWAEKAADTEMEVEAQEKKVLKYMEYLLKGRKDITEADLEGNNVAEQALDLYRKLANARKNNKGEAFAPLTTEGRMGVAIRNLQVLYERTEKFGKIFEKMNQEAEEYAKTIERVVQKSSPENGPVDGAGDDVSLDLSEETRERESLLKKIRDLNTSLIEEVRTKEKQALEDRLEDDIEAVNKSTAIASEKNTALRLLQEKYYQDLSNLDKKYAKEDEENAKKTQEAELAAKVQMLAEFEAVEKLYQSKRLLNGEIDQKTYNAEMKQLEIDLLEKKKELYIQYGQDVLSIDQAIVDAKLEIDKDANSKQQISDLALQQHRINTAAEGSRQRHQLEMEALDLKMQEELANLLLTEEQKKIIEDSYRADKERAEKAFQERQREKNLQYLSELSNAYSSYLQYTFNKDEQALQQFTSQQNIKKEKLDSRLEKGLISEEDYNREVQKIEKATADEEKRIKTEMFVKQKKADIIQAGINTALAITRALSTDPTGILATIVGIAGAAQIAAINAKPVPQYAKGGKTRVRGADDGFMYSADNVGSIAQGGVYSSASLGLVGEKGPELVIPNHIYTNPQMANLMGALEQMIAVQQYAAGGNTQSTTPAPMTLPTDPKTEQAYTMMTAMMAKLMAKLDDPMDARIVWNQTAFEEKQKQIDITRRKSAL